MGLEMRRNGRNQEWDNGESATRKWLAKPGGARFWVVDDLI